MIGFEEVGEGTVLAGRYQVLKRLGTGGMATVFLATDRVLGRRVAVKRMHSGGSEVDLRRFRREARLGATLSHPNLVTVFDTLGDDDDLLIAMEHVEGETLADALDRGRLDPERALEILEGVAAALDHAHANSVFHRDVKPSNVLLGQDGSAKLADLGIATAAEATRITSASDVVGTLAYVSPERLDLSSPGGPEADVYALAALAFECLGGERANRGSTPAEVVELTASAPPPDLRDLWPEASAPAAVVLRAGMSRDPGERPASAGELVERLRWAIEEGLVPTAKLTPQERVLELGDGAPRTSSGRALGEGAWQALGLSRAALVVAGLAVAALAAATIAFLAGGGEPDGSDAPEASKSAGDGAEGSGPDARQAAQAPPSSEEQPPAEPQKAGGEDPAVLNERGYALLQQGKAEEAVPVLERAVDRLSPESDGLAYAYALFNLGSALRQAGRPAEAIEVLEQRLEIPNQKGIVKRELALARSEAGGVEDED